MKLNELKKAVGKRIAVNLILTDVSEGIGEDGKSRYSFTFTDTVLSVEGRMPARYAKDDYFELIGKTVFLKASVNEEDGIIYLSVQSVSEAPDGELDVSPSCEEGEEAKETGSGKFPSVTEPAYGLLLETLMSGCSSFLDRKTGDVTIRQCIDASVPYAGIMKKAFPGLGVDENLFICITAFWCMAGEYEKRKNGIASDEAGLTRGQLAALLVHNVAGTVKGEKEYDLTKVGLLQKALLSLDAVKSYGSSELTAALYLFCGKEAA